MDPRITRRTSLAAALTVGAVGLSPALPALAEPDPDPRSRFTQRGHMKASKEVPEVTVPTWNISPDGSHPWARPVSTAVLDAADPADVGLDPTELDRLPGIIRAGLENDPPRFAGASLLVASRGAVVYEHADGHRLRWADPETELPAEQQEEATLDTIYDIASISKIFTATAVMQLVEQGLLSISDQVAEHLPRFAENGKDKVTVQHLLSHTGGLPPFLTLWKDYDTVEERIDAVLTVAPNAGPGEEYVYSDLGLITLGFIVEKLSGMGLDEYVAQHITGPLGLTDTMYNPPADLLPRIAATEYSETEGGVVRGHVHDENAWSLGGVAGHAGVFSTARDLVVFAQMFLNGGSYGDARILAPETVTDMFTDRNAEVTGPAGERRGLGPELEAWFYHAGLTSPGSALHTGFTGTSVVIDPLTDTIVVMLTNSVHPTREWSTTSVTRREVSTCVAHALGVVPAELRENAWYAGSADDATAILTVPAQVRGGDPTLEVELFAHLETGADVLVIEGSRNNGNSWVPLPGTLTADGHQSVEIPSGQITGWGERAVWHGAFPLAGADGGPLRGRIQLRLRLVTDDNTRGLGAWVQRIRLVEGSSVIVDTDRAEDHAAVQADGWSIGG